MANEKKTKTVFEILHNIQQTLAVKKDRYNAFSEFKYRSAEDIIREVKPLLEGCILREKIEHVTVSDRVYLKVTVIITDNVDFESADGFAREPLDLPKMSQPQVSGAAYSYARKYAMISLFAIDNGEYDLDGKDMRESSKPVSAKPAAPEKPWLNEPNLSQAAAAIRAGTATISQVQAKYKVNNDNMEFLKLAEAEAVKAID